MAAQRVWALPRAVMGAAVSSAAATVEELWRLTTLHTRARCCSRHACTRLPRYSSVPA